MKHATANGKRAASRAKRLIVAGAVAAALGGQALTSAYADPIDGATRPSTTDQNFQRFLEKHFSDRESFEKYADEFFEKWANGEWGAGHATSERRWKLGVQLQPMTAKIAEGLGLDEGKGVMVTGVMPASPAEQAGIEAGDAIVAFNDEAVSSPRQLVELVNGTDSSEPVAIEIWRDGAKLQVNAELERVESGPQVADTGAQAKGKIGVMLTDITPQTRARYAMAEGVQGALVVDVDESGPAFEHGIRPGDVISMVGRQKIESPQDVVDAVKAAASSDQDQVLVLIEREGTKQFVPVPLV